MPVIHHDPLSRLVPVRARMNARARPPVGECDMLTNSLHPETLRVRTRATTRTLTIAKLIIIIELD